MTNFNKSKTNNLILLEHYYSFKDAKKVKNIKSLKHHSSNSLSNFNTNITHIQFINNNWKKKKKFDIIKKNIKKENKKSKNDLYESNINDKYIINTNYSNNQNCTKIQNYKNCFNFYNSRPLTLNFSNEFNSFNSYKILLNNKSLKYLNNNNKIDYKKILLVNNENTSKMNKKGNSTSKDSKKIKLIENKSIKSSKSYNFLLNHKKQKLYNSTSFSYIQKIHPKNKNTQKKSFNDSRKLILNKLIQGTKNNNNENTQLNLYNKKNIYNRNINNAFDKKHTSVKTSENDINNQYFKKIDDNKYKINDIIKNDFSILHKTKLYSKKVNIKNNNNKMNDFYNTFKRNINNNTLFYTNKKKININNTSIMTPEENHFFAVKQVQQIKQNYNKYV